jgi:micrococcal nuclease
VTLKVVILACAASALLLACSAVSGATAVASAAGQAGTVARITDGDTLVLQSGQRVRLLQIDTPEIGGGECFSRAAKKRLAALVPVGSTILLQRDRALDDRDRYGRLLRYVTRDGVNVNLRLVATGAAAPYFYRGDRGRWAGALLAASNRAKQQRLGLWGACPGAKLDPTHAVDTGRGSPPPRPVTPPSSGGTCDPNYAGTCVPIVSHDLDCGDLSGPVRVIGADPHRFDGDGNGYGCESNR